MTFTYDALDRRTNIAYGTQSTVRLQYDSVSRVTNIVDTVGGTIRLAYDALDRLTTERTPNGTNTYSYNDGGLRTNLTMTGETAITYRYDVLNRLTNVVQGSTSASLAYDDLGRRTQLTLPNGMVVLYSYDTASRLTNITYQGSTTNKIEYGYWPDGSRYSQNSALAAYLLPSAVASATYNAANQQLTFGSYTNKYDLNGNVTNIHNSAAATTNRIVWNARNQITNLAGSVTARFLYDGLGRRITRVVGSTTERYHYDGLDIMLQKSSSGTVQTRYFRGLGIDEPWQRADVGGAGTNRSYLADALGSVVALADGSKVIQTEYDYEPFGTTTASGSSNKNAYKFTAREEDGTGLYYYRFRYYHPALARFVSEDPLGYASGDSDLYGYAADNPVGLLDPLGLSPEDVLRILENYQRLTDQMEKDGHRVGLWPPASSAKLVIGLGGWDCTAQSADVATKLRNYPYQDQWSFNVDWDVLFGVRHHQYAVARSSNPADPLIRLDPWWGDVFLYYPGLLPSRDFPFLYPPSGVHCNRAPSAACTK